MRILVIGGTRFIGLRVVRQLAAAGHHLTLFHRGEHSPRLPAGAKEIVHPSAGIPVRTIPDELRAAEPEVVLHMIAMGEEDARAAMDAFAGVARRIVVPSSGDVYKAYGVFTGIEPGPIVPSPMDEDAPLRTVRYPYRQAHTPPGDLEYYYDKTIVEAVVSSRPELPATILRLPKVYGPEDNADLGTIYGFRDHPGWRWTHGHVNNVAAAVALAVVSEQASGRTYNVGEKTTPSIAERLQYLPDRTDAPLLPKHGNFEQDIVYDSSRIRRELGYREVVEERAGMLEVLEVAASDNHQ